MKKITLLCANKLKTESSRLVCLKRFFCWNTDLKHIDRKKSLKRHYQKPATTVYLSIIILSSCTLTGCNLATRLSNVGDPPDMSQIQDPTLVNGYRPVSMPMPTPEPERHSVNSLWQTGSRAFFKDQRANRVGDVITVLVAFDTTSLNIDSNYTYNRTSKLNAGVSNFFGYESKLKNVFPPAVDPASLINTISNPNNAGTGKLQRKEKMDLKIGATIVQILPNGNLVIQGRQEILMQNELRIVEIKGIIRREDIASDNTVPYEKIAEARIAYGGKGDVTDSLSVPWGQQALNKILPW